MKKFSPLKLGIIFFLAASSLVGCMPGSEPPPEPTPNVNVPNSSDARPSLEPDCNGFQFGGLTINLFGDAQCTDDYRIEVTDGTVHLSGQGGSQEQSIKIITPTTPIVIKLTGTEVFVRVQRDLNVLTCLKGSITLRLLKELRTLEAGERIVNDKSDSKKFLINSDENAKIRQFNRNENAHILKRLEALDCERNPDDCVKALPRSRSGE